MLIALPRWDNPDAYYTQTNNVVETILKKTGASFTLATCGPTAAVIILDALGHDVLFKTPGGWEMQPEDALAAWFNDPRNYAKMRLYRSDIDPAELMGNEVPQWYEPALGDVFGTKGRFYWGCTEQQIFQALKNGRGVLATLVKPGHYIAIVGYDTDTGAVIYHDPWPGNNWPERYKGQSGRARQLNRFELSNLKPFRVEIG